MQLVTGYAELQRVVEQKKLAAIIGVEGGHMIEENLACLDSLYARGARYLTLTWNNSISWASSAQDEVHHPARLPNGKGLNEFRRRVIRPMNEPEFMVDLQHPGASTSWTAMEIATKHLIQPINPVILHYHHY